MTNQPSTTLIEHAGQLLRQNFPEKHTDGARVVWWDNGGYLKDIVRKAASNIGVGFRAADGYPLSLRLEAVEEEPETPMVWYIGEGKNDRDWFRDIQSTGDEINRSIEELTAELYDVQSWAIFDVEREDAESRAIAARIIRENFASPGIPTLDSLVQEILTKGGGEILDHLLRVGWPEISRKEETVQRIRTRLRENHHIPIPDNATPEEITTIVRRWAVARALIQHGVDPEAFGEGYGVSGYSPLTELLDLQGARASAEQYLGNAFWPDVIENLDDIWTVASCPVGGALDIELWRNWVGMLEEGEYELSIEYAERRQEALAVYSDDVSWHKLWEQAEHLARLRKYFTAWEERDKSWDPFELYADLEDGSWRIDNEVLQLQLTGTPENGLQTTHPANESLPELRSNLLDSRYKEYLERLAENVETSMQVGTPLVDKKPAYQWWSDNQDDFDELGTVAIFLIDALRFDLAQQLANRLEDEFEVKRETRLSTLPSETKFGMAALTPGRSFRFKVRMESDTLSAAQGDRALSRKNQRVDFLDEEGWVVPDDAEDGWEQQKIAFYDKEIDDVGEGDVGDVERHFREYVEDLAETIHRKLAKHNWDRVYVVTDHGFVLLPEDTMMESISVAAANAEVKYRRVAGDAIDDVGAGVHVPSETAGLDYLDANLQLLVHPRQYFSKQGYTSSRYYHGGLLPQECMLSFLEIQQ